MKFSTQPCVWLIASAWALAFRLPVHSQLADWQAIVWSEPQVRSLLADMTRNGGRIDLYRKYVKEERDSDSTEAIRGRFTLLQLALGHESEANLVEPALNANTRASLNAAPYLLALMLGADGKATFTEKAE